jgi:hypothetical protein
VLYVTFNEIVCRIYVRVSPRVRAPRGARKTLCTITVGIQCIFSWLLQIDR